LKGCRFDSLASHLSVVASSKKLLTLLHSTWMYLVSTKEAAHPVVTSMSTWGSKCQTVVHVSLMGVVQTGLPSAHIITLAHGTTGAYKGGFPRISQSPFSKI